MKKVRKNIEFDEETHQMIKEQSEKAKLSMRVYVRLCIIQCKGDNSLSSKINHG